MLDIIDAAQAVVDGVLFGATYAIIGIGFTLIFGVMHKINMSYAAASIGGAYGSLILLQFVDAPVLAVFLAAGFCGGVIGIIVYYACFRFLPLNNPLATLMSTVGMLMLIDETISHVTTGVPLQYPAMFSNVTIDIGQFFLRGDLVFTFVLACLATVALLLLLYRTKMGIATRAVSQQQVAAQLCGIAINRVNALTFLVTGVLGGLAGALIGASIGILSPMLVLPLTVKGLIVTVIGGLGSIPGAIIAGLMVGAAENIFQFFRGVSERDIYVMLLLFAFLVFRPGGIFAPPQGRD